MSLSVFKFMLLLVFMLMFMFALGLNFPMFISKDHFQDIDTDTDIRDTLNYMETLTDNLQKN
jgi:flagellar basal body-associated protein FliL